jgi:hypothetical protein
LSFTTTYETKTGEPIWYKEDEERKKDTKRTYSETRVRECQFIVSAAQNKVCVWEKERNVIFVTDKRLIQNSPFIASQNIKLPKRIPNPSIYGVSVIFPDGTVEPSPF